MIKKDVQRKIIVNVLTQIDRHTIWSGCIEGDRMIFRVKKGDIPNETARAPVKYNEKFGQNERSGISSNALKPKSVSILSGPPYTPYTLAR